MTNNSKEPNRVRRPIPWKLSKRTTMLMAFGSWIRNFKMLDSFENQQKLLKSIKEAYLLSDYADDRKERDHMLVMFKYLEELLILMTSFTEEDYRKMNSWLDEMTGLIQEKLFHELS